MDHDYLPETPRLSVADLIDRISPPTMADKTACTTEDGSWDNSCVTEEAT